MNEAATVVMPPRRRRRLFAPKSPASVAPPWSSHTNTYLNNVLIGSDPIDHGAETFFNTTTTVALSRGQCFLGWLRGGVELEIDTKIRPESVGPRYADGAAVAGAMADIRRIKAQHGQA